MAKRGRNSGRDRGAADGGQTQRQLRVAELIRQALSEVLMRQPLEEPALKNVATTVAEVRMTPDLKRATCYVMPLGGGDAIGLVKALAAKAPLLSKEVGLLVRLKFTPRLLFRVDQTFDAVDRLSEMLRQPRVAADLASNTVSDPAGLEK